MTLLQGDLRCVYRECRAEAGDVYCSIDFLCDTNRQNYSLCNTQD